MRLEIEDVEKRTSSSIVFKMPAAVVVRVRFGAFANQKPRRNNVPQIPETAPGQQQCFQVKWSLFSKLTFPIASGQSGEHLPMTS
jgi:hypothetical protein